MKNLFILSFALLLLFPASLLAQTTENYTNTRSAAHRQFPGANIWVVPPRGFTPEVKASPGFYKDEFNFVVVEELIGSNFQFAYSIRRQMDEDYTFQAEKLMTINGLEACELQYFDPGARKVGCHTLIIGNNYFAAIIRFFYRTPETSTEAVAACLHSVFADVDQYPNPVSAAGISFDPSTQGYGLAHAEDGLLFFCPMNGAPVDQAPGAMLAMTRLDKKDVGASSISLAEFHQAVLSDETLTSSTGLEAIPAGTPATFNGFSALESYSGAKAGKGQAYVLTVETPNCYFMAAAVTKPGFDAELVKMRQLISSVKFN
ncbi:MAG TPA: hypothetical protein PKL15_10435 [Saprospiraceae bacterium]|nr:hypothetical protein [Saprospiraceae bacterium]HNM25840.1 hypothetical protein [Saprospiraceae bacterium]